jgi:hypothetical protein
VQRMSAVATIIRREPAITVLREAMWRTQKRWKQVRFQNEVRNGFSPVEFRAAGYYRFSPTEVPEHVRRAVLDYADLVSAGKFGSFGHGPVMLGIPPAWNQDWVSGRSWANAPSHTLPTMRHDGSDVKVPWDLSRLQFLPVLGKAWRLSGEEHYRELAKKIVTAWVQENPVGQGINWSVSMEAALRGMSLCLLLELLAPFSSKEQEWLGRASRSLREHLLFIEAHNEFSYFARSNHYLSNIVGLLHLSSSLAGPGMEDRRKKYRLLVEAEMEHQVREDGFDYEASSGYHFLVTQMFTKAWLALPEKERETNFTRRLKGMYEALDAIADQKGQVPQAGDCDDGRVELLTDDLKQLVESREGSRDSMQVGSWIGLGGALLKADVRHDSADAVWYGFKPVTPSCHPLALRQVRVFAESGIATVRRGDLDVLFFAMPNGINGKGSHTHNDKLSVVVKFKGNELFCDRGTYCYSRDFKLRNAQRATAAHNTLTIDRQEQNRFSSDPSQLFRMSDDANPGRIEHWQDGLGAHFRCSHDGYKRLGAIHQRDLGVSDREIVIDDTVSGCGKHLIEAAWHLPCEWRVRVVESSGKQLECLVEGPACLSLTFSSETCLQLQHAAAMISRCYGVIQEGTQIQVQANSTLPFKLSMRVLFRDRECPSTT